MNTALGSGGMESCAESCNNDCVSPHNKSMEMEVENFILLRMGQCVPQYSRSLASLCSWGADWMDPPWVPDTKQVLNHWRGDGGIRSDSPLEH